MKPVFLALLATLSAQAAHAEELIYVSGKGNSSCGQFIIAMDKHQPTQGIESRGDFFLSDAGAYREWTQGFLTAYGLTHKTPRTSAEINGVMLWLKNYCQKDPTTLYIQAVTKYVYGASL